MCLDMGKTRNNGDEVHRWQCGSANDNQRWAVHCGSFKAEDTLGRRSSTPRGVMAEKVVGGGSPRGCVPAADRSTAPKRLAARTYSTNRTAATRWPGREDRCLALPDGPHGLARRVLRRIQLGVEPSG